MKHRPNPEMLARLFYEHDKDKYFFLHKDLYERECNGTYSRISKSFAKQYMISPIRLGLIEIFDNYIKKSIKDDDMDKRYSDIIYRLGNHNTLCRIYAQFRKMNHTIIPDCRINLDSHLRAVYRRNGLTGDLR
jgi:hypothetical protein